MFPLGVCFFFTVLNFVSSAVVSVMPRHVGGCSLSRYLSQSFSALFLVDVHGMDSIQKPIFEPNKKKKKIVSPLPLESTRE